jgi:hypothetical protein
MIDVLSELDEAEQLIGGTIVGLLSGLEQIGVSDLVALKGKMAIKQAILETTYPGFVDKEEWRRSIAIIEAVIAFKQELNRV